MRLYLAWTQQPFGKIRNDPRLLRVGSPNEPREPRDGIGKWIHCQRKSFLHANSPAIKRLAAWHCTLDSLNTSGHKFLCFVKYKAAANALVEGITILYVTNGIVSFGDLISDGLITVNPAKPCSPGPIHYQAIFFRPIGIGMR